MKGSLAKSGDEKKKKAVSFDSHSKLPENGDNDFKPPKLPRLSGSSAVLPGSVVIGPGIVYHNQDLICSSNDVGRVTFSELLSKADQLRVPLFQRRYCWDRRTWQALLRDVQSAKVIGHSLGRALVYHSLNSVSESPQLLMKETKKTEGDLTTLTIIDGQQRMTTLMVLLAALRDVMLARIAALDDPTDDEENNEQLPSSQASSSMSFAGAAVVTAATCPSVNSLPSDQVIFHVDLSQSSSSSSPLVNTPSIRASVAESTKNKLSMAVVEVQRILFIKGDATEVEHCRLVPTHFDRPAFMRAMSVSRGEPAPKSEEGEEADEANVVKETKKVDEEQRDVEADKLEEAALENRICEAKDFFMRQLSKLSVSVLLRLPHSILHRITFLYFNMREQDLMTVYERMAIKEGMFKGLLHVATPGVQMTAPDLTRNLLLSYFVDDEARVEAYDKYWIHIEVRASEKGVTSPERLEAILADYLLDLRAEGKRRSDQSSSSSSSSDDVKNEEKSRISNGNSSETGSQQSGVDVKSLAPSSSFGAAIGTGVNEEVISFDGSMGPPLRRNNTQKTSSSSSCSASTTTTAASSSCSSLSSSSQCFNSGGMMGPPAARKHNKTSSSPSKQVVLSQLNIQHSPVKFSVDELATEHSSSMSTTVTAATAATAAAAVSSLHTAITPSGSVCNALVPQTSDPLALSDPPDNTSSPSALSSLALLLGESFMFAAVEKAFERPKDPLLMTGADRVGGVYGLMRRYLLALVPDSTSPSAVLAAGVGCALMSDLSKFSNTWRPTQSLTLSQQGLLSSRLELVDLIRAMEESKGQK